MHEDAGAGIHAAGKPTIFHNARREMNNPKFDGFLAHT
jgi:hypothetical protein